MTTIQSSQQQQQLPKKNTLLLDMALGGVSSAIAGVFSNPFELIKTRFQLQRELSTGNIVYTSLKDCVHKIVKYEGITSLQNGIGSAVLYQLIMNSTRLGLFEYMTNIDLFHDINGDRPILNFCKNFGIAATSGGLGAFLGSPVFVVKTRLQTSNKARFTHPDIVIGHQYGYKHTFDGLSQIYKQGGINLLYRNSTISAQRVFWGSGFQLSSYDQVKYFFSTYVGLSGTQLHFISSACSSFLVALAMNPFDLVLSRVNNQNVNEPLKYTGAFDCFKKVAKTEGLMGFTKGFWAHYARLAPHGIITFICYERLKLKFKGENQRQLSLKNRQAQKD